MKTKSWKLKVTNRKVIKKLQETSGQHHLVQLDHLLYILNLPSAVEFRNTSFGTRKKDD